MASLSGTTCFRAPADLRSILEEDKDFKVPTSTKLTCTLGPASRDEQTLIGLLEAGMSIARFDFSYGTRCYHTETLENLKRACLETKKLCAVMMDTKGPEVFVTNSACHSIQLTAGQTVTVVCSQTLSASSSVLPITFPSFDGTGICAGSSIFVGQYLFTGSETSSAYLTVQAVEGDKAVCVCNNTCCLEGEQLTVQLAGVKNELPIFTAEDLDNIKQWGRHVDYLAVSFCRGAADLRDARAVLESFGLSHTKIIAKIENSQGLSNYREILEVSDAVILSRGNLGVSVEAEKMFMAQKLLLKDCNLAGIPIYVTRVVDTMVEAPRPTRAEATDVANLVLDGADGIVMGAETFRGKYPVETVRTVLAIAHQAEECFDSYQYYQSVMEHLGAYQIDPKLPKIEGLASSAVRAATKLQAALIVVFTVTGRTARLIAKYRPRQPILTVVVPRVTHDGLKWNCSGEYQARQCLGYRGVLPICGDPTIGSPDGALLEAAFAYARDRGLIRTGDKVVVSQCPRQGTRFSCMQEAGIVKIISVPEARVSILGPPGKSLGNQGMVIGSTEDLEKLEESNE